MDILTFWFPNNKFQKFWFDKSVDQYIKDNYNNLLHFYEINDINLDSLTDNKLLEIIIILDQFSRNIYRNQDFRRNDKKALIISKYFFENRKWDNKPFHYLVFYLMPFRHSNTTKNYEFIFSILNKINENELNENHKFLYNKFYNVTLNKVYTNESEMD